MVKLSIIVPIYGVEQYLHKCVDSLLNQDIPLPEYEIILVDDGGIDKCPQICDDYATAHKNIHVVHRENGGLSAARNSGIEVAQGEYVMFVDSDDYLQPNVLGSLVKRMNEDQLDVLRYNYQNVRLRSEGMNELMNEREYEVFEPYRAAKRDVDYSEAVMNGEYFLNNRLGPMCYAWAFVIRRELLKDCIFKEGIYFEDMEWTPRMLVSAKRAASTETVVYNYFWREGSISLPTDLVKRKKVMEDKISLIRGFKEQSRRVTDYSWFTWMTSFTAMTILNMLSTMPSSERRPYLKELKSLNIFPLAAMKEKMLSHKIKIMIANISPAVYCYLLSLIQNA